MAVIFVEGFDKYRKIAAGLFGGDWNTTYGNGVVDGTNGGSSSCFGTGIYQGDAFRCGQDSGLYKTLPSNYATLIWGCRFRLSSVLNSFAVQLFDVSTIQTTVRVNSAGKFEVRRGSEGGPVFGLQASTLLDTSSASISVAQWHYLEAKFTIDNTVGAYDVYLDGALIMSGSGVDTQASANAYANAFAFKSVDFQSDTLVDDMYVFDTTTLYNNDVIGDSVVETQYPESDATVQFTVGASAFGAFYHYGVSNQTIASNTLYLRTFTPQENCTINSVSVMPESTSVSAKLKMVVYDDNSGAPNNLLSDGTEIIGTTAGTALVGNLAAPQSLTGGQPYWIGFYSDTSLTYQVEGLGLNPGFEVANTYGSGAPLSSPSVTGGFTDLLMWGNVTSTDNYAEVNGPPLTTLVNYVNNSLVNDEDQYNFPALSLNPLNVWAVKVSAWCQKSDAGARNIDLRVVSGITEDGGDNTNQPVTSSFQYLSSHWNVNPDTGLNWDYTTVNSATSGIKVVS